MIPDENQSHLPDYPDEDDRGFGYSVAKSVVGSTPWIGAGLIELIEKTVGDPLKKRQEQWLKTVGETINELIDTVDGLRPETLSENEEFLSVVHHATEIAMRTHSQEKLELLRNAVSNVARGMTFGDDDMLRSRFMEYVESFSPLHVRVLKILQNPRNVPGLEERLQNVVSDAFSTMLVRAFEGQDIKISTLQHVFSDLLDRRLVTEGGFHSSTSVQGMLQKRTTEIGNQFLGFVEKVTQPSS